MITVVESNIQGTSLLLPTCPSLFRGVYHIVTDTLCRVGVIRTRGRRLLSNTYYPPSFSA